MIQQDIGRADSLPYKELYMSIVIHCPECGGEISECNCTIMKKLKQKQGLAYFVTLFDVDRSSLDSKRIDTLYDSVRCWGYYNKEEDAERCIRENWADIYEDGSYNLAMIEVMSQGVCCTRSTQNRWFTIDYLGKGKYDIKEIDCPVKFQGIVGFSYA